MYFVYRDGTYHNVAGQSFRDFMAGKLPGLPGAWGTRATRAAKRLHAARSRTALASARCTGLLCTQPCRTHPLAHRL